MAPYDTATITQSATSATQTQRELTAIVLTSKEARYQGAMYLTKSGAIVPPGTKGAKKVEFTSPLAVLNNGRTIALPAERAGEFLSVGVGAVHGDYLRRPKADVISAQYAALEPERVTEGEHISWRHFGAGLRVSYSGEANCRAHPGIPDEIHITLPKLLGLICRGWKLMLTAMPTLVKTLPCPTTIKGQAVFFPVLNYVSGVKAWRDTSGTIRTSNTTVTYSPEFCLNHLGIGIGFPVNGAVQPEYCISLRDAGLKLFGQEPEMPPVLSRTSSAMQFHSLRNILVEADITL
jgi:hypothetical protein